VKSSALGTFVVLPTSPIGCRSSLRLTRCLASIRSWSLHCRWPYLSRYFSRQIAWGNGSTHPPGSPRPIEHVSSRARPRERADRGIALKFKKRGNINKLTRALLYRKYTTSARADFGASLNFFVSFSLRRVRGHEHQWNAFSGGVMGGKWSPQVGKLGGTGGRSPCVPTCRIRFMPISMWNKKWQWNSQYPAKKSALINRCSRCQVNRLNLVNTSFGIVDCLWRKIWTLLWLTMIILVNFLWNKFSFSKEWFLITD